MNFWNANDLRPFTKADFERVVKQRRKEFMEKTFAVTLTEVFQKLAEQAEMHDVCHTEVSFRVPVEFDVQRVERIASLYFADLGYRTIVETKKDPSLSIITLTLL